MTFKEARIRANITQKAAAKIFRIDRSTISKWESGKNKPRYDMLPRIAAVYQCKISDLFN